MKNWLIQTKFYFFGFGIPLFLVIVWAGKDTADLLSNYWEIRKVKASLALLNAEKAKLEETVLLLDKKDPGAWERFLREARALRPNEVEYRFK